MTRTLEYVADKLQHVERVPTEAEKLACVVRELKYKTRTFARLVDAGKMPRYRQRFELELWYAIVEDYRIRAVGEQQP